MVLMEHVPLITRLTRGVCGEVSMHTGRSCPQSRDGTAASPSLVGACFRTLGLARHARFAHTLAWAKNAGACTARYRAAGDGEGRAAKHDSSSGGGGGYRKEHSSNVTHSIL